MTKEYIKHDLLQRVHSINPLFTAPGTYSEEEKEYNLCCSSFLSFLIKETERLTEGYASDLFIEWQRIESVIKNTKYAFKANINYVFGFGIKDFGVDNIREIEDIMSKGDPYNIERIPNYKEIYRAIYILEVKINNENIISRLYKVI